MGINLEMYAIPAQLDTRISIDLHGITIVSL
jgi:hypothetical protein